MIDFIMHIATMLAGFILSGIGAVVMVAGFKIFVTGVGWVI